MMLLGLLLPAPASAAGGLPPAAGVPGVAVRAAWLPFSSVCGTRRR